MGLLVLTNFHGWIAPAWLWLPVLAGATVLGLLAYLTLGMSSLPGKYAEFWGTGASGRFLGAASLSVVASLFWSIALVMIFGTRV